MKVAATVIALLSAALATAGCGSGSGGATSGAPSAEVLSVAQALAAPAGQPIRVRGALIAPEGAAVRLCSAILESYPPQCGGPSLVVSGLDLSTVPRLTHTNDPSLAQVTWSQGEIVLAGVVSDGILTVQST